MNPFLEPTVATPAPAERLRWPARRRKRVATPGSGGASAESPKKHVGKAPPEPSTRPARPRTRNPLRQARLVAGALMLAGTLLAPGAAAAVDVNAANITQLQEIKGIGPKMARVIIEERERGGRFESITDLSERVKGIGPKKAATMQSSGLSVGAGAASKPPAKDTGTRRR